MNQQLNTSQHIFHQLLPQVLSAFRSNELIDATNSQQFIETLTQTIKSQIILNHPNDNILFPEPQFNLIKDANHIWYINALKGSSTTTGGIPLFFTTLCLVSNNQPIFSFIIDYYKQTYFWTDINQNTAFNKLIPMIQNHSNNLKIITEDTPSDNLNNHLYSSLLNKLNEKKIPTIKFHPSTGMLLTCTSNYQCFISPKYTDVFTYYPSQLIITKSGGQISSLSNQPWQPNDSLICCSNSITHHQTINLISS